MRYSNDIAELARAAALLVASGPPAAGALPDNEQQAALVCRDTVAGELRDLTRAVLQAGPDGTGADPQLLATSPPHALHAALVDLPPAAEVSRPLSPALAVAGSPLTKAWQDAARAAAALERYHDGAAELTGSNAWSLARDVANLAAALPTLDADLATALPPGHPAGAVLLQPEPHGLLCLAAQEMRAHTAALPSGGADTQLPPRRHLPPVRTLADLPDATAHLGALLSQRGAALTVAEARAVTRALLDGVQLTAEVLTAAHPGSATAPPDGPVAVAAKHLQAALPQLQHLAYGQVATLTPPAPSVLLLARQIREQLTTLTALVDRLEREHRPADLARVAPPLSRWALETVPVATAVRDGLHAAATTNQLLAPRQDIPRGRGSTLLWLPLTAPADGPHPVLDAAARSTNALAAATGPLSTITGTPSPADRARAATRQAASHANAAFSELRQALHDRPPQPLPNPTRPAHPALPPTPGTRRSPASR